MSKSSLPIRPAADGSCAMTRTGHQTGPRRIAMAALVRMATALTSAALAGLVGLASASCLSPQDDYNAYVARAADAQAPPSPLVTQDASIDVASLRAPDAGFADTKLAMICLSQLAQDVAKALLWEVDLTYTPAASGGGGTLRYVSNSLQAGSTSVGGASVIAGSTLMPPTATIAADGTGTINIGSTTLPAAQNGITGVPVPLDSAEVHFHVESSAQICANLSATVTAPAKLTLTADKNPCIFLPTDVSSGKWRTISTGDIHCP